MTNEYFKKIIEHIDNSRWELGKAVSLLNEGYNDDLNDLRFKLKSLYCCSQIIKNEIVDDLKKMIKKEQTK